MVGIKLVLNDSLRDSQSP